MTYQCEACKRCIKATLNARKSNKRVFEDLLQRLEKKAPAVAQQIGMACPAHAQDDNSAEWWSDNAPAMIVDMKEALR